MHTLCMQYLQMHTNAYNFNDLLFVKKLIVQINYIPFSSTTLDHALLSMAGLIKKI